MRTTVTLDQDIYEAAMHISRVSGERLGKVLSNLARSGLKTPAPPHRSKGRRFPTFEVPPGTPIMTAERVQRIVDEDPF